MVIDENTKIKLGGLAILIGFIWWLADLKSDVKELKNAMLDGNEKTKEIMKQVQHNEESLSALMNNHISDPNLHYSGFQRAESRFQLIKQKVDILEKQFIEWKEIERKKNERDTTE